MACQAFGQAATALAPRNGDLPIAPSDDTVEVLYGVSIPDPYRPLEDSARADVKGWIEAQDARAHAQIELPADPKATS